MYLDFFLIHYQDFKVNTLLICPAELHKHKTINHPNLSSGWEYKGRKETVIQSLVCKLCITEKCVSPTMVEH